MSLTGKVDALIVTVAGVSANMASNASQLTDHETRLRLVESTKTQATTLASLVRWVAPLVIAVLGGGAAERFLLG